VPVTILVGTQWGDEGKGKATDLLARASDLVVRCQGGNNAGHTIMAGETLLKLRLVPSGILYSHVVPVIGDGVVIDPQILLEELDALSAQGIDTSRLVLSGNAHLTMPYHRELDRVTERWLGKAQLGTTKRGIGPTYADKAARIGLRVQDLTDPKIFRAKLDVALKEKNQILTKVYNRLPLDAATIAEDYLAMGARLAPHIADASALLHRAVRDGRRLLLEGAQGTLLDIDHGTYPFVTSSSTVAGGILAGAGLGPKDVDRVIGVVKAYVTRVGSGPFPTEDTGRAGQHMSEVGHEFGTVTGRPRRCGWFDAVLLRYAIRLNSLTELFVTKLDVLSGVPELRVCTEYGLEGEMFEDVPPHQSLVHKAEPVYEELEGWEGDITAASRPEDLPGAAAKYLDRLADLAGIPVRWVSIGPDREQTLELPG
jgi:adenylosuccinate synthase